MIKSYKKKRQNIHSYIWILKKRLKTNFFEIKKKNKKHKKEKNLLATMRKNFKNILDITKYPIYKSIKLKKQKSVKKN